MFTLIEIIGLVILGLVAGVFGGILGIGGGTIVIPALVFLFGFTQKSAQATTLMMIVPPIGLLAALEYHKAKAVDFKAAWILALFFIAGGFFGGRFAVNIDENVLRKIFAVFLMIVAVNLFFKKSQKKEENNA